MSPSAPTTSSRTKKRSRKPVATKKVMRWLREQPGSAGGHADLEALRQLLRARARRDFWYFAFHCCGMEDIASELHFDMAERFQKRILRRFTLWLIPRSHLKTSLWTVSGSLWELINDADLRILIVNAKLENAIDILAEIRMIVETNEIFRWLFPEYCPDLAEKRLRNRCKWGVQRLDFPCSKYAGRKEGNIEVMGVEASLVSKHYDRFYFDDPVNDENTTTKAYRDKVHRWYRNALQLRHSPQSRVRLIGTRWHYDDLYGRIITVELRRREGMRERGEPIKARYLIYHRQVIEPREDGEEIIGYEGMAPIWPERFTKEEIEELREENGSYIFSCQYMNNPVSDEDAIFRSEDIKFAPYFDIPEETTNILTIDMADEETTAGDFTVLSVTSFDRRGRMYVRQVYRGKYLPSRILELAHHLTVKWDIRRVGVETTGFQRTIYKEYKRQAAAYGWAIPWVEIKRGKTSKRKRFLALQPRVERGDFWIEEGIENSDQIIEEMITYPRPVYDDILDTLADAEAIYFNAPEAEIHTEPQGTFDEIHGVLGEWEDDEDDYMESAIIASDWLEESWAA